MKKILITRNCRGGGGMSFLKGKIYKIPKDVSLEIAKELILVPGTAQEVKQEVNES